MAGPSHALLAILQMGRLKFLPYSWIAYGIGVAFWAASGHSIELVPYVRGLLVVWSTHLMTHYCNEYFDLEADRANPRPTQWTGGSRVLVNGLVSPRASLVAAAILFAASVFQIILLPNPAARWVACLAIAVGWFYTAPPLQLNHRGLGEFGVTLTLNLLTPMYACAVQRGELPFRLLVALVPGLFFQYARMLVMNLLDEEGDRIAGKITLPVRIGRVAVGKVLFTCHVVGFAACITSSYIGALPRTAAALILATVPFSMRLLSLCRDHEACREPATANLVGFLASTQVAVILAALLAGFVLDPSPVAAHAGPIVLLPLGFFLIVLTIQVFRQIFSPKP